MGGGGSPRADPKSDQLPLGPESQIWTTGGPGFCVAGEGPSVFSSEKWLCKKWPEGKLVGNLANDVIVIITIITNTVMVMADILWVPTEWL